MADTPIDMLCAGSSPAIDDGVLDLGGVKPLFPYGFSPLHEGYDATVLAVDDILRAEQRRTGALSLFGMRGRIARELADRTRVDVAGRGLEIQPESWEAFFAGIVLEHMTKLWPQYAPADVDGSDEVPDASKGFSNVVQLADLRAARQEARAAVRAATSDRTANAKAAAF